MKIKKVDIIALERTQGMHLVIAKVIADDGTYGLGETGVAIGAAGRAEIEIIKSMAQMIIGMNPLENDVIWEKLYKGTFWAIGSGSMIISGISAIDTALWDLKGKILGLSVATLLGGKHRSKLRAYASQLQMGWAVEGHSAYASPEKLKEAALKAVDEGYTAVKANVIGLDDEGRRRGHLDTNGFFTKDILKACDKRIAALRDAIGPDRDLILENHAITDANTALQFCKIAEQYDILFMEEPALPLHTDAFRYLNAHTDVPLATGERTYLRSEFIPFFKERLLSVIQPDIGNCGGITEVKKIADMAYCYDMGVQAHVCSSPVSVAVSLQLEAAIPNFVIHEHHVTNTVADIRALCVNDYQPVNGYLEVPDLPGFGQDIAPEALKKADIITVE